jgi:hypothetical protein
MLSEFVSPDASSTEASDEAETLALALNADQRRWLENTARFLARETGCDVTPASIILRLVEHGLPAFEKEIARLRTRSNAATRRFHVLEYADAASRAGIG